MIDKKINESKYEKLIQGNEVLRFDWGYISYNDNPLANSYFPALERFLGGVGKSETAIYVTRHDELYILFGDHRSKLQQLSFDEIINYYKNSEDKK